MDLEWGQPIRGITRQAWQEFVQSQGLEPDDGGGFTVLLMEQGRILACGSRDGNLLKCLCVDPQHQGEGLTGTLMTQLRENAFQAGIGHLFLYTKPKNGHLFAPFLFYPVAQTADVLLMESMQGGARIFAESLVAPRKRGRIGAIVMHADPFTKGHRYLVEQAAKACKFLHVLVVSENRGRFSADEREEMVTQGCQDLKNVLVQPAGPYLVSAATFPTYFLKEGEQIPKVHCKLDIETFCKYYVPALHIGTRFVGTEPEDPVTAVYNKTLQEALPARGVQVQEVPRLLGPDGLPISARRVRALLGTGQPALLRELVPETTYAFLEKQHLL